MVSRICDYFSVSKEVLLYGEGKKYTVNYEKLWQLLTAKDDSLTKDLVKDESALMEALLDLGYREGDDSQIKEDRKRNENFRLCVENSYIIFAKLVEDRAFMEAEEFLEEEDEFLEDYFDDQTFLWYFSQLSKEEMMAVTHLVEDLQKGTITGKEPDGSVSFHFDPLS